jgi:TFIIF-interacting CTD phosphatase-like protein
MKKNIALDIDGTLFYASQTEFENSIKLPNNYYATIRPFVDDLFSYLKENEDHYNVIVYSAATEDYIQHLLNLIDTKGIIKKIYDRKYCDKLFINDKETHVKNSQKLNIDYSNLYLIDDNEYHFNNAGILGIKCQPYKPNTDDFELLNIIEFLETLKYVD